MHPNEDEIWNEYQWERHLNEMEQKSEKLREYIETNLGEQSPRWSRFLNGFPSKLDAIDAYIEDELMFEDAYFPDDEDDWEDDDDDEMDDFFMSSEEEGDLEDMDEGEGWKRSLRDGSLTTEESDELTEWLAEAFLSDSEDLENMKIYDESRELAADMLKLAEIAPKEEQDDTFIQLVTQTVNVGAKIAGAFAFGFDLDVIGGNIAYCKRALHSANEVLSMLHELKHRPYMRFVDYESLHERMFELRNDLGVYIQELREEFNEGLAGEE
jgi:four helix bundle protein